MARIDAYLKVSRERGCSDIHLTAGEPPMQRFNGELYPVKAQPFEDDRLRGMLYEILNESQITAYEEGDDLDFAYARQSIGAFRVNLYRKLGGIAATFRVIPERILPMSEIGVPPVVQKLLNANRGLLLITGPSGCGKTTTMASMVDHINRTQKLNIICLEDPIEYIHRSMRSLVIQREVGAHVASFSSGLREALREDPDVIMVGELRDFETISLALMAAETGHLVLSTLHTRSASQTIDRIIDALPSDQKAQGTASIANELIGVLAQSLVLNAGRDGRLAVFETMLMNPAIAHLINAGKVHQIRNNIETGREAGMQSMDQALLAALVDKRIDPDDACLHARDKRLFQRQVKNPAQIPQIGLAKE